MAAPPWQRHATGHRHGQGTCHGHAQKDDRRLCRHVHKVCDNSDRRGNDGGTCHGQTLLRPEHHTRCVQWLAITTVATVWARAGAHALAMPHLTPTGLTKHACATMCTDSAPHVQAEYWPHTLHTLLHGHGLLCALHVCPPRHSLLRRCPALALPPGTLTTSSGRQSCRALRQPGPSGSCTVRRGPSCGCGSAIGLQNARVCKSPAGFPGLWA